MDIPTSLIEAIAAVKRLPRQGWIQHGLPREAVESVGAHSFGTAALIIFLRETGLVPAHLNFERLLVLAILHDLTEARTGDITPRDGISPVEKARVEHEATDALFDAAGPLARLNTMLHEFIDASSSANDENGLIKQVDKLDMAIQSLLYEQEFDVDLSTFREAARAGGEVHALFSALAGDGTGRR